MKSAWQEYRAGNAAQDSGRLHQAHIAPHRTIWDASDNAMLERHTRAGADELLQMPAERRGATGDASA